MNAATADKIARVICIALAVFIGLSIGLGILLASSRSDKSKLQRDFDELSKNNRLLRADFDSATNSLADAKLEAQRAKAECSRAVATNNELRGYIQKSDASRRELERLARSNSDIIDSCIATDDDGAKLFAECFAYLKLLRGYFEGLEQASKVAGSSK